MMVAEGDVADFPVLVGLPPFRLFPFLAPPVD